MIQIINFLFKPTTCQYIVVLESTLFCEALQNVDSLGLINENVGALISLPSTELNTKEEEKNSKNDLH
jgi:hypothetical protein